MGINRKGTAGLPFEQVIIKGVKIKHVLNLKYLGTIIDDKLSFQENVDHIHKKTRQRFRKLRIFNMHRRILTFVYRSMIESILTYNIISWYGNLIMRQKNK